jgi:carbamoyl-phosphate synthase large subunit
LINYFKEALKGEGKVFATDMQLTAPALVDADVAIQVPAIYSEDYIPSLLKIVKENNIDCVISLNDLELPILSQAKSQIEKLGAKVIVSDEKAIKIAFDKWETIKFLESNGLKSPKTFIDFEEAKNAITKGELNFPLVLKPRWGSASIGIDFPEDMEELELAYKLQTIRLKRTILAEASKEDIDHAILIQEKIPGKEYGMDVLNDFEGNYVGTYVRQKLQMRSGETDKAISVIDERFEKIGKIIGENLKHIGNLDCDVFEHNGELYVLELNPRFGGGYPFSHEAGNNTAAIYIEWLKGNKYISQHSDYKEGIMFFKCDRLLKVN